MKKVEIFQAHTIDELKESVNTFLKSFNDIKVTQLQLSESDYDYKMVVLYETESED